MRLAIALAPLALAACNQILGLDSTRLVDAPPPDAPYRCTDEAPPLRGMPVAIVDGEVRSYSISMDRTLAVAVRGNTLYQGEGDMAFAKGANLSPPPPSAPVSPRLAPEGDELFVSYASPVMVSSPTTIVRYTRAGDGWMADPAPILALDATLVEMSAPTRRDLGPRRMVVVATPPAAATELREYVETASGWTLADTYALAELGTLRLLHPNLTPDGLHLVFDGRDETAAPILGYASRATTNDRFANAVDMNPFFGRPEVADPFLVEDCSRLYFFVVAKPFGVYYVERL